MTIHQLPSGNYNARVRINGKIRSFTADSEDEVKWLVREAKNAQNRKETAGITVQEAVRNFINSRRNIVSPTTAASYEKWARDRFKCLRPIPVGKITEQILQDAVNNECGLTTYKGKPIAPKTVINAYGLYHSAITRARADDFRPDITLPKLVKTYKQLPAPSEIMQAVRGTDIELPVLLAMWMSLTASEIRGIKVSSIRDGVLYIEESIVTVDGKSVSKQAAKEYDRNRKNRIPKHIMELIEKTPAWKAGEGYIEPRTGNALYKRFNRVLSEAKLPAMRFHELRHEFASVALMLGIPQKYIMEKGGWQTPHVLESVYQHTFTSEMDIVTDKIDQYFEQFL